MTEQTPLERLEEAFNGNAPHHELYSSAIAYRDYAEARIKELMEGNHELLEQVNKLETHKKSLAWGFRILGNRK